MRRTDRKDLVVIGEDLAGEALTTLVANTLPGVLNWLAVNATGL